MPRLLLLVLAPGLLLAGCDLLDDLDEEAFEPEPVVIGILAARAPLPELTLTTSSGADAPADPYDLAICDA
ncbi:MAG: hypothetical protein R3362_09660, partial [Rhodothermales bacterium]|nr:hypothetical protein [Rhodothermales bacterium]